MNHGSWHNGSMPREKKKEFKKIIKDVDLDEQPEHQFSQYMPLDVNQKTFEIFMELYENTKVEGGDLNLTASEFLNKLIRNHVGSLPNKYNPNDRRRNKNFNLLSEESHKLLEDMLKRSRNINRRIKHVKNVFDKDEFLKIPSDVIRFEILLAIYHQQGLQPEYEDTFNSFKKHIKLKTRKENEKPFLKMLTRKYVDQFGVFDRRTLRDSIKSQAEDFGIYQLYKNWFEVKYNKSGDTRFIQSFNAQYRKLKKERFIEEHTYKGQTQITPKRDYFKEKLYFWEETPDRFYQFSFNNMASYYGLVKAKFDDDYEILMRMRTFGSTLENNFI